MKVLIIGASGYLGGMLYKKCSLDDSVELYGTYNANSVNINMLKLDIMDIETTKNIINTIKPDIIVWSIMSKTDELEASEVGLTNILSTIAENVRFIYISTLVSSKSNQNEDVSPELLSSEMYHSNYVNGKIRGEELVKAHKNYAIIRPGQIFGFDINKQPDIRMKRLLESIKTGKKCPRTVNSLISIVHVDDLVKCIIESFYNDFVGIINIAAEQPVSYYDFYSLLSKMLGIDNGIVVPDLEGPPSYSFFDTAKCKNVFSTHIRNLSEVL